MTIGVDVDVDHFHALEWRETLHAVRDFMRKEVAPINDDWKPGSFPFEILPGLSN